MIVPPTGFGSSSTSPSTLRLHNGNHSRLTPGLKSASSCSTPIRVSRSSSLTEPSMDLNDKQRGARADQAGPPKGQASDERGRTTYRQREHEAIRKKDGKPTRKLNGKAIRKRETKKNRRKAGKANAPRADDAIFPMDPYLRAGIHRSAFNSYQGLTPSLRGHDNQNTSNHRISPATHLENLHRLYAQLTQPLYHGYNDANSGVYHPPLPQGLGTPNYGNMWGQHGSNDTGHSASGGIYDPSQYTPSHHADQHRNTLPRYQGHGQFSQQGVAQRQNNRRSARMRASDSSAIRKSH